MRALVGSVGYFNLRDMSAGPMVIERLKSDGLPGGVDVFDLSYGGPIATVHRLNETDPPYERLVLVGAVDRPREEPGYRWYRWVRHLPPPEEVQARVAEAVTGVIDLESFPIIAQQFDALPDDVRIVEIQAVDTAAGLAPSPAVEATIPEVCALVRRLVSSD
jgi:Ni,Fe-hydrogenase maturation factor